MTRRLYIFLTFSTRTLFLLVTGLLTVTGFANEPSHEKTAFQNESQYEKGFDKIQSRETLPGTILLDWQEDIGQRMMAGAHRFMDREIERSSTARGELWGTFRSRSDLNTFISARRDRLAFLLGTVDKRVDAIPELVQRIDTSPVLEETDQYRVLSVRLQVFDDYQSEGILIEPKKRPIERARIIIPHNGMPPLDYWHFVPGLVKEAASGNVRIVIPQFLDRKVTKFKVTNLPAREIIYRSAYMLGRHLIGYEVQTVMAWIDWFEKDRAKQKGKFSIEVGGYGDGGMIALYSGALDSRIHRVCVSGYFGNRNNIWKEPLDRNIFGLLNEFGDAELVMMKIYTFGILDIETDCGPQEKLIPTTFTQSRNMSGPKQIEIQKFPAYNWAPGQLVPSSTAEVEKETKRTAGILQDPLLYQTFRHALRSYSPTQAGKDTYPVSLVPQKLESLKITPVNESEIDAARLRLLTQLDNHNQKLLRQSSENRRKFTASWSTLSPDKLHEGMNTCRQQFYRDYVGKFDNQKLPLNPRSRKVFDTPTWTGYEVVLDVFEDVFAYGMLILPKDIKYGEQRPVVVFQHGREGCPESGINHHRAYNHIVPRLADKGYIVFCPQNLYILGNEYRVLQRKCYAVGKTFFGIMAAQHEQIIQWLKTLPSVQKDKIGFYGISYGGKSAMILPAVISEYALSICNSDFNERVVKCASSDEPFSFMSTCEYEMYEFNSANTFNYAEMAMLIAPRPFMVERGHNDGVGRDEYVAFEYAKVRQFYDRFPEISDRTTIEWFNGVHEIHAVESLKFLDRFLKEK